MLKERRINFTLRLFPAILFLFIAVPSNLFRAQETKVKAASKKDLTSDEFNQWTDFIDSQVTKQEFSGVVLLADNGEVKFQKAYGLARRNPDIPNRLDTQFMLASVPKMFTAVCILQLVEKGKLSLDDTVEKLYPGLFQRKGVGDKIKIKHLLNHTSGLENPSAFELDDWHRYLLHLQIYGLADEPATKYDYNDWNFIALGAIIERITGEDYFKYVEKHIYKPLKMTSTGNYHHKLTPRSAIGYYSVEENGKLRFGTRLYPIKLTSNPYGGQYSTVRDLNVFLHALVTNKLLSPQMTRLMMSPKPELNNTRYGYGIQYFLDGELIGHSGGENFYPQDAWAITYPPTGYQLIILSNLRTNLGDDSTAKPILMKLLDFIER